MDIIEKLDVLSKLSHDEKRKVACIILDNNGELLSFGSNTLPGDVFLDNHRIREGKYKWIEHAERNAIYRATRLGISLNGSILHCNYFPCVDCTRAIIQSGIKEVNTPKPDFTHHKWGSDWLISVEMFKECGIKINYSDDVR